MPVVKLKACVGLFVDVLVVSVYRWVWAIIICKSVLDTRKSLEIPKEDRHYNDQMKKNKMTNNDLQNTKAKQLNPSPSFLCESTVILNSYSCIIYLQFCWLNLLVLWFVHSIMPLYVDQMGPLMATSVHSNPLNACKFYLLLTNIFFSEIEINKGNNKITELRTILQRESQNS
jgi:hypothetical protein